MNLRKFNEIAEKTQIRIEKRKSKNDYLGITYSKIETDNGRQSLRAFQYKMLVQIINNSKTFLSNQSHALYGNYYFEEDVKSRKFFYNMVLLENGEVYLHNVTTGKFRRISYELEQRISRKLKR